MGITKEEDDRVEYDQSTWHIVQKSLIKLTLHNKYMPIKFILKMFTSFPVECCVWQLCPQGNSCTHKCVHTNLPLVLSGQGSEPLWAQNNLLWHEFDAQLLLFKIFYF